MVNAIPVANAGSDQSIGIGLSTNLNGTLSSCSGSCLYNWEPSAQLNPPASNNMPNPNTVALSTTTIYTLIVTDQITGCASSPDQVTITVTGGGLSVSTSSLPGNVCPGQTSQLLAIASGGTGSYNYTWSSVPSGFTSGISNPLVNPSITTTYTVTVSDGLNSLSSSVTVNVYSLPVVSWTNSLVPQCINSTSYTLTGGSPSGGTYSGSGVIGTNFNASSAGIGIKTLVYSYTNPSTGCNNFTTNTITVNTLPTVSWSNLLTPQCLSSTVYTLTGGFPVGGTYSGSGVTGTNFNASLVGAGTITLTYSYTNPITGCINSATNTILVDHPAVSWPGTLQPQCITTTSFSLTGATPAGGTYSGTGVSGTNFNASIAGLGTTTLTYTYINPSTGCSNSATNSISVYTNPVATWNTVLAPTCLNASAFALSGGTPTGGIYTGPGVSGNNFTPALAGTGLKTLTYTYTNPSTGCSASVTNTVFVNVLETIIWSNVLVPQCINSTSYILTGGSPSGGTYSGIGVIGNNFNASLAGVGTHTLTYSYTDLNGCTNSTTNSITVNILPSISWTNSLTPQCLNNSNYALSGGNPTGGTYSGPGVSAGIFNASIAGTGTKTLVYSYTNPVSGCISSATNTILVNALPIANAGLDQIVPVGSAASLNGSTSNCTGSCQYNWQPAALLNPPGSNTISNPTTVNLTTSSVYSLIVTDPSTGCASLPDNVSINVSGGLLSVSTSATPNSICLGQNTQLQATASGGTGIYS